MWNWSGIYQYQAAHIATPTSTQEVAQLVKSVQRARAVGTRHCFNDIADSPGGVLISTEKLNRIVSLQRAGASATVTVEPGVTYGQLGPYLHAAGWGLANLASLPHISIAGSVATGTHGSGERLGCLSTAVAAMELVLADGSTRTLQRGDDDFAGAVVHLGALGIVTKLTLDLVPTYQVAQHVYDDVPIDAFVRKMDDVVASVYSISAFTDWQRDVFDTVWMKSTVGDRPFDLTNLGGTLAHEQRHPIRQQAGNVASEGAGGQACTVQRGIPGPWHERLPHFRMEFTPSSGEEIQSEYFVPRKNAAAAMAAVASLRTQLAPLLQVSEVRFIAGDDLWLSMCCGRDSVGLHFTWRKNLSGVLALLPELEAALSPFDARPHWGKVFTTSAGRLQQLYPQYQAFRQLRQRMDPRGKFRNAFLGRAEM